MSTAVALRFPWGRYHATAWGRNVNEVAIDWPPSPWRVLRALYSTWKNRAPELDEAVVLGLFDKLSIPPTFRLPVHGVAHTRHYMPDNTNGTDKVLDGFIVVEPSADVVIEWEVDLDPAETDALRILADRLGYLGRAESVCEGRLLDGSAWIHRPVTGGCRFGVDR
jgi:CRISPR-associated protein Csb2